MEAIEMRPCPNPECQHQFPPTFESLWGYVLVAVHCNDCGMMGPRAYMEEAAARLWNLLPRVEPIANSQRAREAGLQVLELEESVPC